MSCERRLDRDRLWTLKVESWHDANFTVTGGNAGRDDTVGIMAILGFQ